VIIKFCLVFPKNFLLHKVVRDAKKVEKHCTNVCSVYVLCQGGWGPHFADQKLIFERSLQFLLFRHYFKYILKCSTAFQFSCLEALDR